MYKNTMIADPKEKLDNMRRQQHVKQSYQIRRSFPKHVESISK